MKTMPPDQMNWRCMVAIIVLTCIALIIGFVVCAVFGALMDEVTKYVEGK